MLLATALSTLCLVGCEPSTPESSVPTPAAQKPPAAHPQTDPATQADIVFNLSFDDAARHLIDVEGSYPVDPEAPSLELKMATWTPGSYLIREYSRHVEGLGAVDSQGQVLDVTKTAKNRWRVGTPDKIDRVIVRYRVYAREMSVRTNFVDAEIAMLNGAPTFIIPMDGEALSHEVRLSLPDTWSGSATALESLGPNRYFSPNFDVLVDSPIVAGRLSRHGFEIDGVPHELVQAGDYSRWDNERAAEDVARLALEQTRFWGDIPYPRYLFLNVITEAGGGLEHSASTLMLSGRFRSGTEKGYRRWLGLVSHEFFHTWNVKRLRPKTLGPFDYEQEAYTRSLWIAEGLTSYYGPLLLRRAGLYNDKHFLKTLSSAIENTQKPAGRKVRSVAESSFDAWIKGYRPDENSSNTAVSYYSKGQVVGFLLDAEIRSRTADQKSLDQVMQAAYAAYSGDRGFTPEEFRRITAEVIGEPMDDFFDRYVDGTEELDYAPALEYYGLRLAKKEQNEDAGEDDEPTEAGWLGLSLEAQEGRAIINLVPRDTPAWQAGLNVDDEILAIGDYRVDAEGWSDRLEHYPPGTETHLWISRRDRLMQLPVTFGKAPEDSWELEVDPEAGSRAKRRRSAWLEGPS